MAYENGSVSVKGKIVGLSTTGLGCTVEGRRNFVTEVQYDYQGKTRRSGLASCQYAVNQLEIPESLDITIDRDTGSILDCPLTVSPPRMRVVFTKWHWYFGALLSSYMALQFWLQRHALEGGGEVLIAIVTTLFITYVGMMLLAFISAGYALRRALCRVAEPLEARIVDRVDYFHWRTRSIPVVEYTYNGRCYRRIPAGRIPLATQQEGAATVQVFIDPAQPDTPFYEVRKQDYTGLAYLLGVVLLLAQLLYFGVYSLFTGFH